HSRLTVSRLLHYFSFSPSAAHRDLHSFPTRRSSDLGLRAVRLGGCSSARSLTSCWKRSRSSARSIDSGEVPMIGTQAASSARARSEEHTSELQSRENLVCRLLLEKKKKKRALRPTGA